MRLRTAITDVDRWRRIGVSRLSVAGWLRAAPLTGKNAGGYLSRADDIFGGHTLANGVVIKNASGGNGDDTITGNKRMNVLDGFDGIEPWSGASATFSALAAKRSLLLTTSG